MMNLTLTVVDRITKTDDLGKTSSIVWSDIRKIKSGYLLPFGQDRSKREYGLEINSTHRTFTSDDIKPKEYVTDGSNYYLVLEVSTYIHNRKVVILERVD